MSVSLENATVAMGLEKVNFHSVLKKGNEKGYTNYPTIVLISHAVYCHPAYLTYL